MHTDIEVYVNFLKPLELDQLIVFDIHSQIGAEMLSGSARSITYVYPDNLFKETYAKNFLPKYNAVIAPDAGAVLRAQEVADILGVPVLTATKSRDPETGRLSNFHAPEGLDNSLENVKYLIVDDICDGGGTFIGLAEALGIYSDQLDLYVSHGVFSKEATTVLPEYFGDIFTTNSYNPSRDLNIALETTEELVFHRFDIVHLLQSYIKY
jgi:ribose-phosphate pyrophosphokinase